MRTAAINTHHRNGRGPLVVALILLVVLPWALPRAAGADDITLEWTAPGDDGNVGTATAYELYMSTHSFSTRGGTGTTLVTGTPAPAIAGTRQSMVVTGLTNGTTYYFAIWARDEANNWSPMSNLVTWNWVLDTTAPAAPLGLSALLQGSSVRLNWTANGEPDLEGYGLYRSMDGGGSYLRLNGGVLVSGTQFVDNTVPGGSSEAWYQVSAQDVSGNESARSAVAHVDLTGVGSEGAGLWTMETGYPNPSGSGAVVRLPVVVPSGGGSAVVEIMTSSGQRVRRLELAGLGAGATEVQWDGKNEAGREVAPGTYTAWLIAGGSRMSVRLVRVP